jgi:paraquat-inducible protein B
VQNLATLTGSGQNELQDTVKSMNGAVHDLDRVLNNLDNDVRPLGTQLPELLKELKNTARSATSLLDYVDQHPEALLLGRTGDAPPGHQTPSDKTQ